MINVCETIQCPYFEEQGHNYGCQRYVFSEGCHLRLIAPLGQNGYILYSNLDDEKLFRFLKVENDRYFLKDSKYAEDVKFQKENPDWFNERSFKVKEIK